MLPAAIKMAMGFSNVNQRCAFVLLLGGALSNIVLSFESDAMV